MQVRQKVRMTKITKKCGYDFDRLGFWHLGYLVV